MAHTMVTSAQLKRKLEKVDEDQSSSSPSSLSFATLDSTPSNPNTPAANFTKSNLKKSKRTRPTNVTFDQVTEFLFPRCQGFASVPSQGGCTLGMMPHHSEVHTYGLSEPAVEQRSQCVQKSRNKLREKKLEALTLKPHTPARRAALLKASGVKKIDKKEGRQLRELRISRQNCGCDCQDICEPETCSCSLAVIKCQVEDASFPCGCTEVGCMNTQGRIQVNPTTVHGHYESTIMRLELEESTEKQEDTVQAT